MEQVDARRALELLIDVVDQHGEDTVYEKVQSLSYPDHTVCRYEVKDQPSCLVGQVLFKAGASLDRLKELDLCDVPADRILWGELSKDARMVLFSAQVRQDGGDTWGVALEYARKRYEKIMEGSEQ